MRDFLTSAVLFASDEMLILFARLIYFALVYASREGVRPLRAPLTLVVCLDDFYLLDVAGGGDRPGIRCCAVIAEFFLVILSVDEDVRDLTEPWCLLTLGWTVVSVR